MPETRSAVLIDTCVWLDLAKDHKQEPLLIALEELVRTGVLQLLLPRVVLDEFARNKKRVIEESGRSLSGTLKRAKEAVERFGHPRRKRLVLDQLNDVDHRVPLLGEAAAGAIARIEALFASTTVLEISDAVKLRAAQRGIDRRAPFHRQRNGMDDAILIEVYRDAVGDGTMSRRRLAFVTHNTKDFSCTADSERLPHPDIADSFSKIKSLYFIRLGEALRRLHPARFSDLLIEQEWVSEPRHLRDIIDAIDLLTDQVWYNRHQFRRELIARGKIRLVEKETFPITDHRRRPIQCDVWLLALKAAARVEKERGLANLGPWTDFEWGMVNGKLSALRWVLGEEWDMLDT